MWNSTFCSTGSSNQLKLPHTCKQVLAECNQRSRCKDSMLPKEFLVCFCFCLWTFVLASIRTFMSTACPCRTSYWWLSKASWHRWVQCCTIVCTCTLLTLWSIYLWVATKNSHRKEIGDRHNFQYTARVRQSSPVSYVWYKKTKHDF